MKRFRDDCVDDCVKSTVESIDCVKSTLRPEVWVKDIWVSTIALFLDPVDIISLHSTSHILHQFFHKSFEDIRAKVMKIRDTYKDDNIDYDDVYGNIVIVPDDYQGFVKKDTFALTVMKALLSSLYNNDLDSFGLLLYGLCDCRIVARPLRRSFLQSFCDETKIMIGHRRFVGRIIINSLEASPIDNQLVMKEFEPYRSFNPNNPKDRKAVQENRDDEGFSLILLDFEGDFVKDWCG